MKRIIILLLSILLISACSSNDKLLSNGDDIIFKNGNKTYTKDDLYRSLKATNYTQTIISDICLKIAEIEELDLTSYEESAQSQMEMYTQMYGLENFDMYGGEEAFKKELIADGILYDKTKDYFIENIEEYVKQDTPVLAQIAYFDDMVKAKNVIEEVNNNNATFDMAVIENGFESGAQEQVYISSDSSLDEEVSKFIFESEKYGLSDIIDVVNQEDGTTQYYIINVISRDYNDFKDTYVDNNYYSVERYKILKDLFTKYDIHFYDKDTYDLINSSYKGALD